MNANCSNLKQEIKANSAIKMSDGQIIYNLNATQIRISRDGFSFNFLKPKMSKPLQITRVYKSKKKKSTHSYYCVLIHMHRFENLPVQEKIITSHSLFLFFRLLFILNKSDSGLSPIMPSIVLIY